MLKPKYLFLSILFACLTIFVGCDLTANENIALIEQKLKKQFHLYEQAQDKIINQVVQKNDVVTREEWETWLTPKPENAFNQEELAQLTQRQQQVIEKNRLDVISSSTLDLDMIRNDEIKLEQYCREFPKGGMLHIHPSGTRNKQTVHELLEKLNPMVNGSEIVAKANDGKLSVLYPEEIDFLSNLPPKKYLDYDEQDKNRILALFFLPDNPPTHDFKRFEAIFSINDLLDTPDKSLKLWVEEKTYIDFLKRNASQNVSYVEFTKVMWPKPSKFKRFQKLAKLLHQETGIIVRWNLAFIRTLDFQKNTEWAQELISVLEDNQYPVIVGIDLLANEENTPALETGQNIYIPILAANKTGKIKIHRTMHAGELGLIHNVRDAMIMGVERVGHGVLLAQDPIALEYAIQVKRLPIAINLYSNYRLQVNEDFSKHPFLNFLRLGLPVSLSTDDEGMLITDITNEYKIAIKSTDITHNELKQMSYNSIKTSFADEVVKTKLLKKLDEDFATFEAKWSKLLKK